MQATMKEMEEFHKQLKNGSIQRAYKTLLLYMMRLRTDFKNKYSESSVSTLYQGYMDMTYFAISTPALKQCDLKIAIVFNYEAFRFEAWLAGRNRKVNRHYWELLKERKFSGYRIVTPEKGVDSIIEYDLAQGNKIADMDSLTKSIERNMNSFIIDIEEALRSVA